MARSYRTRQRRVIMEYVAARGGEHFTADGVCRALRAAGSCVGRATVYRCFERLVSEGLLRKYTPTGGGAAVYNYCVGCSGHYHLHCDVCGETQHFECAGVEELYSHLNSDYDFQIDAARTVFHGVCGSCRGKGSDGQR